MKERVNTKSDMKILKLGNLRGSCAATRNGALREDVERL
jgi:hypothetical protein